MKIKDLLDLISKLFTRPFDPETLAEEYITAIGNMVQLNGAILNINYTNFSSDVFSSLLSLSRNVILPIGYSILAFFLVLDMYSLFSKTEGLTGNSVFLLSMKIVVKTVLFKLILDRSHNLLEAIRLIMEWLQKQIVFDELSSVFNPTAKAAFIGKVEKMNFIQQVMLSMELKIYVIISAVIVLIVSVIIIARVFELYVYVFIAPIPLATLPGTEMSQIGKNFLKSFTAICLQGIMIALILYIYAQFAKSFAIAANLEGQFWKGLTAALVLIFCLLRSSKWAKSITNSM